jgi:hypothetical protein
MADSTVYEVSLVRAIIINLIPLRETEYGRDIYLYSILNMECPLGLLLFNTESFAKRVRL